MVLSMTGYGKAEKKNNHALRISVVGGGCSGMNYNIAFDEDFNRVLLTEQIYIGRRIKDLIYSEELI